MYNDTFSGIAGGHTADVCVGDIVVGEYCVNLNAFKTPFRAQNEGSDALDWKPKRNRGHSVAQWLSDSLTLTALHTGVGGGHQDITDESHLQRRKIQADRHLQYSCRLVAEGSELYKPLDKVSCLAFGAWWWVVYCNILTYHWCWRGEGTGAFRRCWIFGDLEQRGRPHCPATWTVWHSLWRNGSGWWVLAHEAICVVCVSWW